MTDILVKDFTHYPGLHCGSVAMANILRHEGIELSESMVFGLGSGPGFFYLEGDLFSPSRQILGRHWNMEEDAASALGLRLMPHYTADPEKAWSDLKHAIDEDRPVLLQCDLSKLPYWNSRTAFNGHRIVVVGYNLETNEVIIADTHFEELQRVSIEALAAARASKAPPSMDNQHAWWILEPGQVHPLPDAIVQALKKSVDYMENDSSGFGGLGALRHFANTITQWRGQDDAAWCFRFAYQCIERRGTGGAMFRNLYRNFLIESGSYVPEIVRGQLGVSMSRTADAWQTLGRYMLAMAEHLEAQDSSSPDDPSYHLEAMAEAVYQFESTFWDRLGSMSF